MSEGSGEPPADDAVSAGSGVAGSSVPPPGNSELWQDLVQRFAPAVWKVAREYHLDPAEAAEVSRTTWLRLVENLPGIEDPGRIGAWLLDTARRESVRILRLTGRPVRRVIDLAVLPEGAEQDEEVAPGSTEGP